MNLILNKTNLRKYDRVVFWFKFAAKSTYIVSPLLKIFFQIKIERVHSIFTALS